MDNLIQKAKALLESGAVQLVIGYGQGSGNKVRALFIDNPSDASKLIFDSRCVQNLAVYLTKTEVRKKGKIAIAATIPVMRSLVQLASEHQFTDEAVKVLGLTTPSELIEFGSLSEIETFLEQHKLETEERDRELIKKLDAMKAEERWNFWMETLAPCFKCYACRAACPLCYCTQCTVESNRPQWIRVPSQPVGNLEWHIMRAMHMAGRCTDCGSCAEACPVGIPLNLLTRKINLEMKEKFGDISPTLNAGNAMSTFKPDDPENFIK
jgi:ferredoxin